jgi:hypothetical protein
LRTERFGLIAKLAAPLRDGEPMLDDMAAFAGTAALPTQHALATRLETATGVD